VEGRARLRIPRVELALQARHQVDRAVGGDVRVDDPVPQPLRRPLGERHRVAVHHPIDGAVTDGMRAHVHPRRVVTTDHRAQRVGIERGIATVARIHARLLEVPLVVHPGGARTARPIGEELDATGDHMIFAR